MANKERAFACGDCGKSFTSDGFLERHRNAKHTDEDAGGGTDAPDSDEPKECDYCYEAIIATIEHGDAFAANVCTAHLDWFVRCVKFVA